jgi:uncharacterized protein
MKQEFAPTRLDVKAFAHSAGEIAGHDLLSKYDRLMKEAQGLASDRMLKWSARGELRTDEAGAQQVWLHLTVDTRLPLTCQRCMGPVDIEVALNQSFRFVGSEKEAAVQDEAAEEDVLALDRDFSLFDLIEDEVLMALPLVPRHETCPVDVRLVVVDPSFDTAVAEKRNPFAVLAKLQDGKSG